MENIVVKLELDTTEAQEQAKAFANSLLNSLKSAESALSAFLAKQQELKSALTEETALIEKMAALKSNTGTVEDAQNIKNLEAIKNRIVQLRLELELLERRWQLMNNSSAAATTQAQNQAANNNDVNNTLNQQVSTINQLNINQNLLNSSLTTGTANANNFASSLHGFLGVLGVAGSLSAAFSQIQQVMDKMQQSVLDMYKATAKFRDMNQDIFESMKPVYNAMGISGSNPQTQLYLNNAVMNLVKNEKLDQHAIADAATQLITQIPGFDITKGSGAEILKETSRFTQRGINPSAASAYVANILRDKSKTQGKSDQQIGTLINQELSNVMAISGGSTEAANQYLENFEDTKAKYEAAGFSDEASAQVWQSISKAGVPLSKRREVESQFFTGYTRFMGKDIETDFDEYVKTQLGDTDFPGKEAQLRVINNKKIPLEVRMQRLIDARPAGKGTPSMDNMMMSAIKTQSPILPSQLAYFEKGLTSVQRSEINRNLMGSGSKSTYASNIAGDWQDQVLATSPILMPSPTSAVEEANANAQFATYQGAAQNQQNPATATIDAARAIWETYLEANPAEYPPIQNPQYTRSFVPFKDFFSGGATKQQIYLTNAYADQLVYMASEEVELENIKNPTAAQTTRKNNLIKRISALSQTLGLDKRAFRDDILPGGALGEDGKPVRTENKVVTGSYLYKAAHGKLEEKIDAVRNLQSQHQRADDYFNVLDYRIASSPIRVLFDDDDLPDIHYDPKSLINFNLQTGPHSISPEEGANLINPDFVPVVDNPFHMRKPSTRPTTRPTTLPASPPSTRPTTLPAFPPAPKNPTNDLNPIRGLFDDDDLPDIHNDPLPEKLYPDRPTTQPTGPQSINYNIRNTNYGYSYDFLGAQENRPNNFG